MLRERGEAGVQRLLQTAIFGMELRMSASVASSRGLQIAGAFNESDRSHAFG